MRREVLVFGGGEEWLNVIEGGGVLPLNMERMRIDLQALTTLILTTHATMAAYLLYPSPQKASNQKLVSLKFCLYDDELEVGLGVHVAGLVFNHFNLAASLISLDFPPLNMHQGLIYLPSYPVQDSVHELAGPG